MKKGLAVFSGSAVVHKLMQDGTVVLGTAENPASVTVSGSLTASADSIEVGNVSGEFTNTTLGGILVELKQSGSSDVSDLRSYVDSQDVAVGNAAAAALGAYTASNNAALATETADRIAGDAAVAAAASAALGAYTSSNNAALATEIADRIAGDASVRNDLSAALTASSVASSASLEGVRSDLQGQIDLLAGGDLSGTLSSIAEIQSFLDGQAGGVEGILTGFNDLSVAVNAISGALTQEITDRNDDVTDLQGQIDSLSAGSSAAVDDLRADFNEYTSSNDSALAAEILRATTAEATLTTDLAAEVTRATAAEATLTTDLAAEIARATAAEGVLTTDLAQEVIDREAGDATNATAISTEQARAEAAEASLASDIADEASRAQTAEAGLASDIADVASDLSAETTRALAAEADLQTAIDTEKGRIDAILAPLNANYDTFKEVVDLINSVDTTNSDALAGYVTSNNAAVADIRSVLSASVTGALEDVSTEQARAEAAEAGLQAQIDSASFSVNGMSVDPFGGSFSIVSSSNIDVSSAAGVVTVSLKDSVSITGSLSAAQLSASAGLSVAGGATVDGGLTVSTGDMNVSQGAVSTRMTRTQAAARTAQDGDMFYLTDTTDDNSSTWPRGKCWYFRQDGEWFDAPFYMG